MASHLPVIEIDDLLFSDSSMTVSRLEARYGITTRTVYRWLEVAGISAPKKSGKVFTQSEVRDMDVMFIATKIWPKMTQDEYGFKITPLSRVSLPPFPEIINHIVGFEKYLQQNFPNITFEIVLSHFIPADRKQQIPVIHTLRRLQKNERVS